MARGLLFAITIDRGAAAKVRTMPNNPHALTLAQNDGEIFEVMESSKSDFDLKADRPRPTGRTKRRSDVHRDRDWHRSAHVWLVDPPRQLVAVQKRSEKKDTFPDAGTLAQRATSKQGHPRWTLPDANWRKS